MALLQMVIRSALAALQPEPMWATELLVMARAMGLSPLLAEREGEAFVEFWLAEETVGTDDPEELDRELNRRQVQMLQLVGRVPDEAARKELAEMQAGILPLYLMLEQQKQRCEESKLAAKVIRREGTK